uniref:Uncharacterized protein n=1 Tax=Acrobeloides nanus TaxID=290746 RepID=A0A914DP93_9BILA
MAEHLKREDGNKVAFRHKYHYDDLKQNKNRFTNMDIEIDFIKADGSRIKFRSYEQLGTQNDTYECPEGLRQYQARIYSTPMRNHLRRCRGRSTSPGASTSNTSETRSSRSTSARKSSTATSRKLPANRKSKDQSEKAKKKE